LKRKEKKRREENKGEKRQEKKSLHISTIITGASSGGSLEVTGKLNHMVLMNQDDLTQDLKMMQLETV